MSLEKFDDECKGCRPAMLDVATGKRLPEDHPAMISINAVWETLTTEQKTAFHNVCCLNSRDPQEIDVFRVIQERMSKIELPSN